MRAVLRPVTFTVWSVLVLPILSLNGPAVGVTATEVGSARRTHSHHASDTSGSELSVPRILHQIFLAGEAEYEQQAAKGRIRQGYRDGCREHHPDWDYQFWARGDAEELIKKDYPWFWTTWANYTQWVGFHTCVHLSHQTYGNSS